MSTQRYLLPQPPSTETPAGRSCASHCALQAALGDWGKGARAWALHTPRQEFSPEKSHIPLIVVCTPLSPLSPISSVTWSCAFEAASVNFPVCVNGLQVYSQDISHKARRAALSRMGLGEGKAKGHLSHFGVPALHSVFTAPQLLSRWDF